MKNKYFIEWPAVLELDGQNICRDRFLSANCIIYYGRFAFSTSSSLQARSQDFRGEGARFWITAPKGGSGCHPRKIFEKRTCYLVHYIAYVAIINH